MKIAIGFCAEKERASAARLLSKKLLDSVKEDGCWIVCPDKEIAADVAAVLIGRFREFEVIPTNA